MPKTPAVSKGIPPCIIRYTTHPIQNRIVFSRILLEDRLEARLLVGKVVGHVSRRDAGGLRDLADARAPVALSREEVQRGLEDGRPALLGLLVLLHPASVAPRGQRAANAGVDAAARRRALKRGNAAAMSSIETAPAASRNQI